MPSEDVELLRKNAWRGNSDSLAPTLARSFELADNDAYAEWFDGFATSDIVFDFEIYDTHHLVYERQGIAGTGHRLMSELEPCSEYRWSVRPRYRLGDDLRLGQWMRAEAETDARTGKGLAGRAATKVPAYTQDFAALTTACG